MRFAAHFIFFSAFIYLLIYFCFGQVKHLSIKHETVVKKSVVKIILVNLFFSLIKKWDGKLEK